MGRTEVKLRYLNWADAKGARYYYYRRNKKRFPLPDILDPNFKAEYDKVHASFETNGIPITVLPGSIAAYVADYKRSADFTEKAKKTQTDYSSYLAVIVKTWGTLKPEQLGRAALLHVRDAYKDTPRKANYFMTVVRLFFYWLEDREIYTGRNPARKPRRLKEGPGHRSWTNEEISQYWTAHKNDPMRLLAAALGLFAGQRRGDVIARNKSHWNGVEIVAVARKNDEPLWISALPPLKALIDHAMADRFMMLVTKTGRPFTERSFSKWFAEGLVLAALPSDLTFHGLRTTAAEILAEHLPDAVLQALFGWRSQQTAAHYRRKAQKRRLALAGMKVWGEQITAESLTLGPKTGGIA